MARNINLSVVCCTVGDDMAMIGKQGRTNWKVVRGRSVKIDEKEDEERTC